MTTKNKPPARAAGRRKATAPTTATPKHKASIRPDEFLDSADPVETRARQLRRDPAEIAAVIQLEWAMVCQAVTLDELRTPGSVCVVSVPTAEWAEAAYEAWRNLVSGHRGTVRADCGAHLDPGVPTTVAFARSKAPDRFEREREADALAEAVWRGHCLVGFAPDAGWLPPDLVTAADYRLLVNPLHADAASDVALRLTGTKPKVKLTASEAAAASPRMLRLASRPGQTADRYLRKLMELVRAAVNEQQPPVEASPQRAVGDGITLDLLAGMDEAVAWGTALKADLDAYRHKRLSWADVDRGILVSGPPGCGKTLFAQALATTCDVPLIEGSYSNWLANGTGHQGDLMIAMRKTFAAAREAAPCILFLDEVDSFPNRSTLKTNHREWIIEVVNALLAELDGVQGREGVVVVGACNNPQFLDPALVRSGRLDRHVRISLPGRTALACIMRQHLGDDLAGIDLDAAALLATSSTGADIERFVRGARRRARSLERPVELADLVAEIGGRDDRTADERMRCAIHEAGHAVVSVEVGQPIAVISIRVSDRDGGFVHRGRRGFFTTSHGVYDETVCLLAGRAAEEVVLGEATSGAGGSAGSDLALATWLTMRAGSELGLDEEHGLVWEGMPDRRTDLRAALSGDPALAARVRAKLAAAYRDAVAITARRKMEVVAVAATLLARGALDHDDIARTISDVRRGERP